MCVCGPHRGVSECGRGPSARASRRGWRGARGPGAQGGCSQRPAGSGERGRHHMRHTLGLGLRTDRNPNHSTHPHSLIHHSTHPHSLIHHSTYSPRHSSTLTHSLQASSPSPAEPKKRSSDFKDGVTCERESKPLRATGRHNVTPSFQQDTVSPNNNIAVSLCQ